jgi:hypothetical protein
VNLVNTAHGALLPPSLLLRRGQGVGGEGREEIKKEWGGQRGRGERKRRKEGEGGGEAREGGTISQEDVVGVKIALANA